MKKIIHCDGEILVSVEVDCGIVLVTQRDYGRYVVKCLLDSAVETRQKLILDIFNKGGFVLPQRLCS